MFIYCTRLYEKHRKPILPIAVFSYNDQRTPSDDFTINISNFPVTHFNYHQIHLAKLNWRKYLELDNPIAAALPSKMGYTDDERVQVKLEFLRMISRLELNPAEMELLYGFFNTYLHLNEKEENQMSEEIAKMPKEEAERVRQLPNYYFDKGVEKGIEKGKLIEKEKVIIKMLLKGASIEFISEVTGVSIEEINKLKNEL
ncbi:conserved hypothetical protein (putative transposase or invertase) [Ornithinibacillus halophilus]|uniref:Transposase (putative) YhgA-like domain-containing protein n=2 Tax=Ornithinibacillus halophilus TaxID=930117 RepID=A0A1M5L618_9BACI|nr:conserved hypothetical protein (putative transposase or invertase) [Ornithinibacillus halophilus]